MTTRHIDDWRAETQTRLSTSELFKELKKKCESDEEPAGQQVLSLIDDATLYAVKRTKTIIRHMREFTLHDSDHLFRVLHLMERLMPSSTLEKLSVPELMLLILSAFFHDIGMAPSEKEVRSWLAYWDKAQQSKDGQKKTEFAKYVASHPDRIAEIKRFQHARQYSKASLAQEFIISEYIRDTHAQRARRIIFEDWSERIVYRDIDLTPEFAALCFSHARSPLELLELDSSLICGPGTYACLPFLGVILRLSDILDFDLKRTPEVLFHHLGIEHPVSLREWAKHRQISSWVIETSRIAFVARCKHPAIEATIREFIDIIDRELADSTNVLQHLHDSIRKPFPDHYALPLPPRVLRDQIGPAQDVFSDKPVYRFSDCKFSLEDRKIVDLLMGANLYGGREVAMRELIQNSLDACNLRAALEEKWGNLYQPGIEIRYESSNRKRAIQITDNGIGMDVEVIKKYYSVLGASYYDSPDYLSLRGEHDIEFHPISRFGIGLLSCFLVADHIEVDTRRLYGAHRSSDPVLVRVDSIESLFWFRDGTRTQPGTKTKLFLRPGHQWAKMNAESFAKLIKRLIVNPPFPITIRHGKKKMRYDSRDFVSQPADMRKPKPFAGGGKRKRRITRSSSRLDWSKMTGIRRFDLKIDDQDLGLAGRATVGLVEQLRGRRTLAPVKVAIESTSEIVKLNNRLITLPNRVVRQADALEVRDGSVKVTKNAYLQIHSRSQLSLHGIAIETYIFQGETKNSPWATYRPENPRIVLPFPAWVNVDVTGRGDLDLNTARTEVIFNEKWSVFSENITYVILRELREQVDASWWRNLRMSWRVQIRGFPYVSSALNRISA